ncbi:unnamed protein product [Phaedon cochleariae]|uniref:ATP-dependent DNA helicase n=1 Tax=Phaedon cochleariae TaxID=80249 RepID=A0A9N9SN73_PHACE|nr:unnamed protein product [Phaedon cochleariae]
MTRRCDSNPAQYERNRRFGYLVHALARAGGGAKLPSVGLCLNAFKAVSFLVKGGNDISWSSESRKAQNNTTYVPGRVDDDDDDPITRVGGDDEHDNHPGDGRHHRRRRRCRRGPQPIINWDEIKHYQNYRYVGALEACWRLFEFKITDRSHSVSVLPVHAENDHQVIFDEYRDTENEIVDRATKNTKLIAYFNLNRNDPEARLLRYVEIPERYSWNGAKSMWQRRKKASKVIGQLANASPDDQTRFYLRMLLQHVGGVRQASRTCAPSTVSFVLISCRPVTPWDYSETSMNTIGLLRKPYWDGNNDGIATMWRNHRTYLISDFMDHGVDESEVAERMALYHVSTVIGRCALGGDRFTMADLGLPVVNADDFFRNEWRVFKNLLVTQDAVDRDARGGLILGDDLLIDNLKFLNQGQKLIFDTIFETLQTLSAWGYGTTTVAANRPPFPYPYQNLFFIDGPGGTGRTFLYNCIIGKIRRDFGKPIIAVAWTGIAATLLSKGTTVHSAFKLPLKLNEDSIPGWPVESDKARINREAPVIL